MEKWGPKQDGVRNLAFRNHSKQGRKLYDFKKKKKTFWIGFWLASKTWYWTQAQHD